MVPHGFRFNPTDEELIQILHRKASSQEMPLHFIVQTNIYDLEPQDLEWNPTAAVSNGERYYYCKRKNDSREVPGRGWWKATSHVKKVFAGEQLVGYKRPLTFHRYKDHQRSRNNAIKTNWIMHEYSLEAIATEWRLCKIWHKGKPSLQEEMDARIRQSSCRPLSNNLEASSSNINLPSDSVSEKSSQEEKVVTSASSNNGYQLPSHYEYWNYFSLQQPYDPNGYYNCHNVDDQPEQSEPTECPFPSLWSWHN